MENNHLLHKKIGNELETYVKKFSNCRVIKSPECGGERKIPLYCSKENGHDTNYCEVDLLILSGDKIKVIVEIEESDKEPIHIFGKFLASALSPYYIYNSKIYKMDDSVTFIQMIDASKLKGKSSKCEQFANMKKSIQFIIPVKNSKIDRYELISEKGKVINFVQEALR